MTTTTDDILELVSRIARAPEVMDEGEAAEYLRLSPRTLEKWRARGEGPSFCPLGGKGLRPHVRYMREDLLNWLRSRRKTPGGTANGSDEAR